MTMPAVSDIPRLKAVPSRVNFYAGDMLAHSFRISPDHELTTLEVHRKTGGRLRVRVTQTSGLRTAEHAVEVSDQGGPVHVTALAFLHGSQLSPLYTWMVEPGASWRLDPETFRAMLP